MMLLSRMERDLLDFLCCCAEKRIGVTKINESRAESLERLRDAQQIRRDSFEPFPWALEAWRQRQLDKTTASSSEPMGPPEPQAAGSGDAALCSDAGDQHAAGSVEAASPCSDHCKDCSKPLSARTARRRRDGHATGRCKPCHEIWRRAELAKETSWRAACEGCGKPLSPETSRRIRRGAISSGRCRTCANQELNRRPDLLAKKSITMKRKCEDPVYREALIARGLAAFTGPRAAAVHAAGGRARKGRKFGPQSPEHKAAIAAGLKIHFERRRAEQQNITAAPSKARKAPGAAESTAATRISDRAAHDEPAPDMLPRSASAHVSGAALAAEIEAFCLERGVAPSRFGKICMNGRGGIVRELKRRERPADEIARRIRDAIADPPEELFQRGRCRVSYLGGSDEFEKIRRTNARRADTIRKGAHAKAMARIEQGLGPGGVRGGGVHVRIAQIAIEQRLEEERRRLDPVERAKTILRRRYAPVVGAEIVGGAAGMFVVGRKTVSEQELIAMAERMAA